MTIAEVIAAVGGRVAYLRATTDPEGADWRACDALIGSPRELSNVIRGTCGGFGTDDLAVAASLFTQAYAFRVASVVLAAYALDLPVPDADPTVTAVRVDKPRPTSVAHWSPTLIAPDVTEVAGSLVDRHLAPLIAAVHREFAVGERLLWGDVAAACAVVFRAVEGSGVDRAPVRTRGAEFFARADPRLAETGTFTTIEHAGATGWYWDRRSCCLWYKTRAEQLCDNCSLLGDDELLARRRAELEEAGAS